ncbi:uncharacterized protein CANTADRAFT_5465 [Suhomyces tanzawaensis NRRL Y-17324]|uniref:C2H2-type domain-containing protein n=1 Tax=Suhomyces tanzawaensis NRRL Y-17324 TaxID=984487 RepID=A0A1E4SJS0_9ASCO|nr:uncharacterized protein CANTADRAFT_5465 [Suhomyces tanzawaensis NRRL Y-17324]ODV79749.1 hypothetical protein CANTADRAFT_5465 [Suhomyces tanzawaensis NRRL Y-17324]
MSDDKISVDQYGRRSWNVEAYAKESKQGKRALKEDTQHANFDSSSSQLYIEHRDELLKKLLSAVKTYNIINPLNSGTSFGNNKRFGFFCPICNVSFRDNMALIDHFNSPQHVGKLSSIGLDGDLNGELLEGGIRRASLADVVKMVELLVAKLVKSKTQPEELSFKQRVERRRLFEEKKREKKQQRKARKINPEQQDDPMASMMGFSGFGTTKK